MLGRALRKGLVINASETPFRITSGSPTVAGVRVSPSSALAASAVYSATSLIAETIGALPIRILERDDQTRIPQKPAQAKVLWGRPNAYQTTSSFIETVVLSKLLWGNAYIATRYTNGGDAFELWPLDPDRISDIETFEVGGLMGLRFRVMDFKDMENLPGKPPQMIHIPDVTAPGRVKGISRIEQLAELVGMSLSAQEHAARFLGEGIHMSGTIEVPKPMKKEQARELWDGFQLAHAGPKKAGRFGVLTDGATFKSLAIPPVELQFLEQMKYSDAKIAGIYRVPPHMIGDVDRSTSWGAGIESQSIQFIQHTLLPIMRDLEEAFEGSLLAGTNYQMRFITTGLLRGEMAARKDFYQALWNMGVVNADQIAALEDMPPPVDGSGARYYVTANAVPAGDSPLKDRAELASALVRAGYDPIDAAKLAGIDPIRHLGLLPVTLQSASGDSPLKQLFLQMQEEGRIE